MFLIYTPKYEAHAYTRRAYAAMRLIEAERSTRYALPGDLIIPVIMTRHPVSLPPQITGSTFYVDFSHTTMASADLKSNPASLPDIDKMVKRIAEHYACQKKHAPPDHDCNQFVLPAVPPAWRDVPDLTFPNE